MRAAATDAHEVTTSSRRSFSNETTELEPTLSPITTPTYDVTEGPSPSPERGAHLSVEP
jgi:hypothetical protein